MSKISGQEFGLNEAFKMRVVSGMLVDGSILISWATGEPASSQIDWGWDDSVPFQTPEVHAEPEEMVRYHQLYLPQTLVDQRHYFRVRSRTEHGKIGISDIYMVVVPPDLDIKNRGRMATEIELELVLVKTTSIDCTNFPVTSLSGYRTEPIASDQPAAFDHEYSQPEPLDQVKEVNANNSSSLTTNISYTIT
ncbi:hypothetical protein [Gracilimonas amylolytica]|uniref:hypothetical protein n=1 Tax=Gracilimonas amylolytica TaxID=1749045 RepID=UPI000CD85A1B|nr:hypothetical protein [Gracilimonas amylolytica]